LIGVLSREEVRKSGCLWSIVLINNAGITYVKELVHTTEEEWDNTLDINLKGMFLLFKAILPQMMKNNFGIII